MTKSCDSILLVALTSCISQVLAVDGGRPPKSATASVMINVQDVNDNDPVFEPKLYYAVVSEDDPPGTPVASVTATDKDENPRYIEKFNNIF
jgi:cadherin EGF LAG seven-pass G-type receptor 1